MATSNDLLIKQHSVVQFLAAEGCSAANIHARMKTVNSEMCISDFAVRKWVRIFKGEDPRETILRDRKRSGRPLSASDTAHREKVDCMIRANRRVKQKEIADEISILKKKRVHHIVTTVLGYQKVSARWVPRQLITVEMEAQRKDICTQLLERYIAEGEAFLQRILTETNPGSTTTIQNDSILQHDNARPHTSRQTQDALRQRELTTLPHPAYSSDLAPSDYYLFPQLNKYLKGYHYDNDEEVIADVRRWCRGQSSEFFADGVRQLVKHWRLCVDRDGDCVEK
ncbi:histone-lysine N-methyltransferase SETMAR [Plakobranchus ocellatus]|uniref:Histone-lysine N-methyltransferase SETMAR n=1 Tax=Plakobranchus ocellatus TaxID=259542 RepID=A0AAV4ANB6_9GAST|nr:histone-lysine N-methyltransferase SETMAR [Plakobranchus ocellatus]